MNMVAPIQDREVTDTRIEFYDPPRYRVDGDEVPGLVARGVIPFRFLAMREDFATRFLGCESADHVLDVLLAEGAFPRPGKGQWRDRYDKRVRAARARVKKRRERS